MIRSGTTLKGRYVIRERIAKGGFATVYTAWDETFERLVAVKVVDLAEDENGQLQNGQELLREARVVAASHHPNVLDVYDFGDLEEQTFLVMPFADGGTLHQLLRASGPLGYEQTGSYLQQIAAGLDHAHRLRVVHRDLKPQNLLLFGPDKQRLVISDFGVAKAVSQSTVASAHITGTPRYMAPEQFQGRSSYSSDIYALGVLLYQMLAGEVPFKGDQAELLYNHTTTPPPTLSLKRQDAPVALDRLIFKAMAKDPALRPKSAGELAYAYQQILNEIRYATRDLRTEVKPLDEIPVAEADSTIPFTPTPAPLTPTPTLTPATPSEIGPVSTVSSASMDAPTTVTPVSVDVPTTLTPVSVASNRVESNALVSPVTTAIPTGNGGDDAATLISSGPSPRKNLPLIIGGVVALVVIAGIALALVIATSNSGSGSKVTATAVGVGVLDTNSPQPSTAAANPGTTQPLVTPTLTLDASPTTAPTLTSAPTATLTYAATPTTAPYAALPAAGDSTLTTNLEIWTDEPQNPDEGKVLANTIASFNKLFPNVKVTIKSLKNDELETKFPEAVQAGNGPDLVLSPVGITGEWVERKAIRPLDNLLGQTFLQEFEPNALAGSNLGGVGYGLPYNYGNILLLYYNKKLTPTAPASFDDLIKTAQSLTKGDGSQVGFALNRYDFFWLLPFLNAFEGWPVDNAGQVTLNTAPMRNALQYFKDLTDKYKVVSPTLGYDEANKLFVSGKLAFFINGDWELNSYLRDEVKSKVDLGVAPLPAINGRTPHSMTNGRHYFLSAPASGDRLKAALYFLQFQARPDQQKQLLPLGLLSPTKAVLSGPEIKNNPLWASVVEQLKDAKIQPVTKGITKVWTSMNRWMKAVMDGTASPAEAAGAMQEAAG